MEADISHLDIPGNEELNEALSVLDEAQNLQGIALSHYADNPTDESEVYLNNALGTVRDSYTNTVSAVLEDSETPLKLRIEMATGILVLVDEVRVDMINELIQPEPKLPKAKDDFNEGGLDAFVKELGTDMFHGIKSSSDAIEDLEEMYDACVDTDMERFKELATLDSERLPRVDMIKEAARGYAKLTVSAIDITIGALTNLLSRRTT